MRNLAIAYGNNRQAKTWVNKTIRFDELKERLKVTIRTQSLPKNNCKRIRRSVMLQRPRWFRGRRPQGWSSQNRYCGDPLHACFGR